jgi:hypothetical protein
MRVLTVFRPFYNDWHPWTIGHSTEPSRRQPGRFFTYRRSSHPPSQDRLCPIYLHRVCNNNAIHTPVFPNIFNTIGTVEGPIVKNATSAAAWQLHAPLIPYFLDSYIVMREWSIYESLDWASYGEKKAILYWQCRVSVSFSSLMWTT